MSFGNIAIPWKSYLCRRELLRPQQPRRELLRPQRPRRELLRPQRPRRELLRPQRLRQQFLQRKRQFLPLMIQERQTQSIAQVALEIGVHGLNVPNQIGNKRSPFFVPVLLYQYERGPPIHSARLKQTSWAPRRIVYRRIWL